MFDNFGMAGVLQIDNQVTVPLQQRGVSISQSEEYQFITFEGKAGRQAQNWRKLLHLANETKKILKFTPNDKNENRRWSWKLESSFLLNAILN